MVERIIQPNPLAPKAYETGEIDTQTVLIERFRQTRIKIAIQKDGELTEISRTIYGERLGIGVPPLPTDERSLLSVSEDGAFGFLYARNKDICNLVAAGAVDQAVVGMDRLVEDEDVDKVEIVAEFPEYGQWSIVLATPAASEIKSVEQIRRVATKYPVITRAYFNSLEVEDVEVIAINGGSEMYPYLTYRNGPIDAIVDLTVTGNSLNQNGLVPWMPAIGDIYPVLIRAKALRQ